MVALGLLVVPISTAGPASAQEPPWPPIAPTHYVTMSDGTEIALNVRMPEGFQKGHRYPTILEMSGYDGASNNDRTLTGYVDDELGNPGLPLQEGSRQLTEPFYGDYVTVHASVRGTGCSQGEFDLFSWRSALDGREVIEWIAAQKWSNGKVGIMGHSYSGITGFMVSATRPPHLVAATVSGLIDDIYRGITYPGGVANIGFPVLWSLGVRPAYDVLGGQLQPIVTAQDERCARNIATHRRTVLNDPVPQGLLGETDNEWYRARSLATYAHLVNVPIHITGAYQDEQTGARGPAHLWEMVRGVPKRLLLTNGNHGTNHGPEEVWDDRVAWVDHWIRGVDAGHGTLRQDRTSVTVLFEMHGTDDGDRSNGRLDARAFPLETTRWSNFFFGENGVLSRERQSDDEPPSTYYSGTGRQSWNYEGPREGSPLTTAEGPDQLMFRSEPVDEPTAIVGPIVATLYVSSTSPDPQFFVQLADEGPDGSVTYLQRGVLRGSHRALTPGLSDWDPNGGHPVLYRPYRPHANAVVTTPGQVYKYLVEVWPVGHVFRPDHRIVVKIHAPPLWESLYAYAPRRVPSQETLLHDSGHPSRIMLPVVPLRGVKLGPELPCGEQTAVRCIP